MLDLNERWHKHNWNGTLAIEETSVLFTVDVCSPPQYNVDLLNKLMLVQKQEEHFVVPHILLKI